MSAQVEIFSRTGMWQTRQRLEYWAGYSWTAPARLKPYTAGQIATPRWARRVRGPLMLDNGAWPAFRDGIELTFEEQAGAMGPFVQRARWIIAPDIVAGGSASWTRTLAAITRWPEHSTKLLLPIQEGIDPYEVVTTARQIGAGVFVGGKTHEWKIGIAKLLRALGFGGRIHVGRVAHPRHLAALAGVATSIDNTSWVRSQNYNRSLPLGDLLKSFIKAAA